MKKPMQDEKVAFKLVDIYFAEIARLGFKRSLDLDAIINAYFYTLSRLKNKDTLVREMAQRVIEEEEKLKTQSKEEMIPSLQDLKERIPSSSTTSTTVTETKVETQ